MSSVDLNFTKMQGTGNDYLFLNMLGEDMQKMAETIDFGKLARKLSDRHFGIGSDGLILICPSKIADCRMQMWNADGSEGAMCGNGIRCLGKYVYERGLIKRSVIHVETISGIRTLTLTVDENTDRIHSVCVDMGIPTISPNIEIDSFLLTPVSIGNPHAVYFVPNSPSTYPVEKWGSFLENHPKLEERSNIEFTQILSQNRIRLRIWERGSGETLSCGTGACAAAVCAIQNKGLENRILAEVLGGTLTILWNGTGESVLLTGPAEFVFETKVSVEI